MTHLAVPNPDLFDAWVECVRDFGDGPMDGSGNWRVPAFAPDRRSFRLLLQAIQDESDAARGLLDGRVPCDYYWVMDGALMVGFVAVRHALTERLENIGHIGYSIRPSCRRRGHAYRALGLALDRARQLGLDRVLLTCDEDNVASARTIERQGGVFEGVCHGKNRYWIPLHRAAVEATGC